MTMMQLLEAAHAVGGEVHGADAGFDAVCADSRVVKKGDLFIALKGARFDGHDFVGQAAQAGAVAAVVQREHAAALARQLPLAAVSDTTAALGALAAHWRARFDLPLVAVGGSNGKTTVKEMIAGCLREHWGTASVLAAYGNLNNHIGLPLTLLGLRGGHRAAVVEVGMNHPGETAYLAGIARPGIALVNNAQREHQEFMRSVAEVALEHGALFSGLPPGGIAVINADDDHADYWRGLAAGRRIRDFGLERPAAVQARYRLLPLAAEIELRTPEGEASLTLQAAGRHNVRNALAAVAAATAAGVPLAACVRALGRFAPVRGRMQAVPGIGGALLLDDTYNANPDSVRAAIAVLARLPGRKLLVLGDMGEVGSHGIAYHQEVGAYARTAGVDRLYALGEMAAHAARSFGASARHYMRIEDLMAEVETALGAQATVLVKGSRFMQMERVVRAFAVDGAAGGERPASARANEGERCC
jgi:UDP-N-acetylmuramoyl-tripeptide--D-alanyl-D-alanine ligase